MAIGMVGLAWGTLHDNKVEQAAGHELCLIAGAEPEAVELAELRLTLIELVHVLWKRRQVRLSSGNERQSVNRAIKLTRGGAEGRKIRRRKEARREEGKKGRKERRQAGRQRGLTFSMSAMRACVS